VAEIIKTYKQSVPAMRFIGKKYGDEDRVDGGFGAQWNNWFSNSYFSAVEEKQGKLSEAYEDAAAYVGLMRHKDGEPFEYWIGLFTPEGTDVPDGYLYVDFPKSEFGVCYLYGDMGNLFGKEEKCGVKCDEEGYPPIEDEKGATWFFERYNSPRFTQADEKGNVILDIVFFVE